MDLSQNFDALSILNALNTEVTVATLIVVVAGIVGTWWLGSKAMKKGSEVVQAVAGAISTTAALRSAAFLLVGLGISGYSFSEVYLHDNQSNAEVQVTANDNGKFTKQQIIEMIKDPNITESELKIALQHELDNDFYDTVAKVDQSAESNMELVSFQPNTLQEIKPQKESLDKPTLPIQAAVALGLLGAGCLMIAGHHYRTHK